MGLTPQILPQSLEVGQRIRARREKLGLSQEKLGERSGLHFTFVSQLERGERNPTLMTLIKVAEGLDVDPGTLIKGLTSTDPPVPRTPRRPPRAKPVSAQTRRRTRPIDQAEESPYLNEADPKKVPKGVTKGPASALQLR